MKAITLWQPWAQLIFIPMIKFSKIGAKRIETWSWNTKFRGSIAIHAAQFKKIEPQIYDEIREALEISERGFKGTQLYYLQHGIPGNRFGAILGTVEIVDCVPIEKLYGTEYDTPLERACGDWSLGRYGWILKDPEPLSSPIQAKGSQGFWNWDQEEER